MSCNIVSKKINLFVLFLSSFIVISCGQKSPITVLSPDGKLKATVTTRGGISDKALMYNVTFGDTPVVSNSQLGIILKDTGAISDGLRINGVGYRNVDDTYSVPYGKVSEIRNNYNEAAISLEDSEKRKLDLIFRVYNDGVAFRYHFPVQEALKTLQITGEISSFNFLDNHSYWGIHLPGYTTSYETDYTISNLTNIKPDSLTALPLLIKVSENVWVGLTEANLTDYAGMYVKGVSGADWKLTASLSPLPDSSGICVKARTPHLSPWRVLMIGDNPGSLVESNIILNLNEPCAIDVSWIKPGKSAWDWWNAQNVKGQSFEGRMDDRTMKHFIDFAGEYGLEYMLIDAGWYRMFRGSAGNLKSDITASIPEIDIPELVEYANKKGVDIILWLHWLPVESQMDEAFALYEQWGVKGVKIDFMDSDSQEMVNFYHRAVKKAAEHKLVVDFHGAYKPTGLRRTYPNLITREGVMGLEYNKWSRRITPDHDCIIPFTRMLAGPMDYTPGGFNNAAKDQFIPRNKEGMTQGTRCHQLALFVIFESPLQCLADYPENYRNKPGIEFLRHVPTTWDETRVLYAQVGDYTTFARKNSEEWYLGSITDWTPREFSVNLDFLGDGDYVAEIFADGENVDKNAENVSISKVLISADRKLNIKMGPGGGHAVRFYPAPEGADLPRYQP